MRGNRDAVVILEYYNSGEHVNASFIAATPFDTGVTFRAWARALIPQSVPVAKSLRTNYAPHMSAVEEVQAAKIRRSMARSMLPRNERA